MEHEEASPSPWCRHDLKPSEEYKAQSKGLPWNLLGRVIPVVCGSGSALFLVCQHFIVKSSSSSNKPTKTLWQIYEDLTLLMLNCLINDKLSFICKFGHSVLSRQKRLLHIRFFKYWEGKWNRKMHRHGRAFSQVSGAVARRVMFTALRKTGLSASTRIWKKNVPGQGAVPGNWGRMCVIVSGKPQQSLRLEMVEGEQVGSCRSWIWVFTTCFFIPETVACSQLKASLK